MLLDESDPAVEMTCLSSPTCTANALSDCRETMRARILVRNPSSWPGNSMNRKSEVTASMTASPKKLEPLVVDGLPVLQNQRS